jgi:hypothetical protein
MILARRLLLALVAVSAGAPMVLFGLGLRGEPTENRAATPRPDVEVARLLSTDLYEHVDDYGRDAMPGRTQLIETDAMVDMTLWRESPNPDVGLGTDGWLFLVDSWRLGCRPEAAAAVPTHQLVAVVEVLEASGRGAVLTVAPNKATAYPDHLGPLAEQAACLDPVRARTQAGLMLAGGDYVDLFAVVTEERDAGNDSLYYADDTHWKPRMTMSAARRLLDHFDPDLWDGAAVAAATETRVGDLTRLIGRPDTTTHERLAIDRAGPDAKRLDENDQLGPNDWRSDATEPVLGGHTLVVHDSFLAPAEPWLADYLERSRFVDWTRVDDLVAGDKDWLISQLVEADRVILQLVERNLLGRYALVEQYPLAVTPEALVAALRDDLAPYRRPVDQASSSGDRVGDDGPHGVNIIEPMADGTAYVIVDGAAHAVTEPMAVSARAEIYDIPRSG